MTSFVELAASLLAALALTLAGRFVELQSVLRFAAGELSTVAWFALLGMLLLYAGVYLLGDERVVAQYVSTAERRIQSLSFPRIASRTQCVGTFPGFVSSVHPLGASGRSPPAVREAGRTAPAGLERREFHRLVRVPVVTPASSIHSPSSRSAAIEASESSGADEGAS